VGWQLVDGDSVTVKERAKNVVLGMLVVLAVVAALFVGVGVLSYLRGVACDRLDAKRIAFLEPGHTTPGPHSIYVKGVGRGPPKSQIIPYLEAEAEMRRSGCPVK
jgi:hypothetical protein